VTPSFQHISHPNITVLLEHLSTPSHHILVLPYYPGGDLLNLVNSDIAWSNLGTFAPLGLFLLLISIPIQVRMSLGVYGQRFARPLAGCMVSASFIVTSNSKVRSQLTTLAPTFTSLTITIKTFSLPLKFSHLSHQLHLVQHLTHSHLALNL